MCTRRFLLLFKYIPNTEGCFMVYFIICCFLWIFNPANALFAVFFLSFWIVPLDEFWHGMQSPNRVPYRYAFLFSFFLILTAYFQYRNMEFRLKPYLREGISVFLVLLLCANMYFNSEAMIKGLDGQFGYKNISQYREFYQQTETILSDLPMDKEMYRSKG